ncbi:MAG: sensor histidine kinase [Acidimicrobiales bacterium]
MVARFALAGLVALMAVAVATAAVSRRVGMDQAKADARQVAWISAKGVVEPALTPQLLAGDPDALNTMDQAVRRHVLQGSLVRVKLWNGTGEIVYSDDQRLIGERFEFDEDAREVLAGAPPQVGVSDLSEPENRFEDGTRKLLEVYLSVTAADGEPMLFEAYFLYDGVIESGRSVWLSFAPLSLGALVLLEAVQIPFALSMARRLRRGQQQREALLRAAIDASENERRRIAADLHDGVVQDLTGVSYALAALSRRVLPGAPPELRAQERAVAEAAEQVRVSVRGLRSMLVDIYPPDLNNDGLDSVLAELMSRLAGRGMVVSLDVQRDLYGLPPADAALLFRAAQEASRNVLSHASARHVHLEVRLDEHVASLRMEDDGLGFHPDAAGSVSSDGHVGLRVLGDLVAEAGGTLTIASAPGAGTELAVTLPRR